MRGHRAGKLVQARKRKGAAYKDFSVQPRSPEDTIKEYKENLFCNFIVLVAELEG
jgi:hypothetical protein